MYMMETKDIPDWQTFERELKELRAQLTERAQLLFRGQNDVNLGLTTTLERAGCERMFFADYYRLAVHRVGPAVETFTGKSWELASYSELESELHDPDLLSLRRFPSVGLYRYMVYLRHHGFPSPLLDWTYSPHVAAFFAFRDSIASEKRSIYVYCEMPKGFKGGAVGEPTIRPLGPYVRSHPRHFRQQSDYTICANFDINFGWFFHPHEPVFGGRGTQDMLWKFNFPSVLRTDVLRLLDEYNLNAFSLFDSEEALLETMWFREHILRGGPNH